MLGKNYYIVSAIIAIFLGAAAVLIQKKKKSKVIVVDDVLESYYYRYGGEISWIRNKLQFYQFKFLSSMLACKNSEESDFRIDILEGDDGKKMSVYATEYSYKVTLKLKRILNEIPLTEAQYENFLENHLKTHVVRGADAIRDNIQNKKMENI